MFKPALRSMFIAGFMVWQGSGLYGAPAPAESLPKDAVPVPSTAFPFDQDTVGKPPIGFEVPVSASTTPERWSVQALRDAPSKPNGLMHSPKTEAGGETAILLHQSSPRTSGEVAVRFKTLSTEDEQITGLVFRYLDADNYWLLALSTKDDNGSLFQVKKGKRKLIDTKEQIISPFHWHEIKLVFTDNTFTATLDHELLLGGKTRRVSDPGRVGIFTASGVTAAFDDFRISR